MGQKVNPIGLRLGINRTWDRAGTRMTRIIQVFCTKISNCVTTCSTSCRRRVLVALLSSDPPESTRDDSFRTPGRGDRKKRC